MKKSILLLSMSIFLTAAGSAVMLIGTVHAEDNALKGFKLGFGFDLDFGFGVRYKFQEPVGLR